MVGLLNTYSDVYILTSTIRQQTTNLGCGKPNNSTNKQSRSSSHSTSTSPSHIPPFSSLSVDSSRFSFYFSRASAFFETNCQRWEEMKKQG